MQPWIVTDPDIHDPQSTSGALVASKSVDDSGFDLEENPVDLGSLVESIEVAGLHGRSTFELDLRVDEPGGRLSLLYGENGAGKTTLLRLLWDLLSPARNRGHRTRVSRVAFERIKIDLANELSIAAIRKLPVAGPYRIEVRRRGRLMSSSRWPENLPYESFFADWDTATFAKRLSEYDEEIVMSGKEVLAQRKYYETLEKLGGAPFYLADDRSTASDEISPAPVTAPDRRARAREELDSAGYARSSLSTELARTLDQVNVRLRRVALGGAVSGSAGANSVYLEVIRHLGDQGAAGSPADSTRTELIRRVRELGARSHAFEVLGLIPRFVSSEYVRQIEQVPDSNVSILQSILVPYLQSMSARLDALVKAQRLIQTLLDEANGFLSDKRFVYERRTLKMQLLDGTPLEAHQLSSGECHVLLLLLSAVEASGHSRVFLVDEPELSLNVKWQRRILKSLLTLTEGSGLQFVVATHSIELLSGFRSRVVKMREEDAADE